MIERDGEVRAARDQVLKVQKDLEEQLNCETAANQDLQVSTTITKPPESGEMNCDITGFGYLSGPHAQ